MSFFALISSWANEHPGQALGAVFGFIIGLLVLIFGILKTLLVIVLSAIGFIIGKIFDEKIDLFGDIKGIFRRKGRDEE